MITGKSQWGLGFGTCTHIHTPQHSAQEKGDDGEEKMKGRFFLLYTNKTELGNRVVEAARNHGRGLVSNFLMLWASVCRRERMFCTIAGRGYSYS
jgi:hypothetical protein